MRPLPHLRRPRPQLHRPMPVPTMRTHTPRHHLDKRRQHRRMAPHHRLHHPARQPTPKQRNPKHQNRMAMGLHQLPHTRPRTQCRPRHNPQPPPRQRMPHMTHHIPPRALAEYDQAHAEISESIDAFIAAYQAAEQQHGTPYATVGMANVMKEEAEQAGQATEALAQHLAIAVARISHLQQGIQELVDRIDKDFTDNDSPPAN